MPETPLLDTRPTTPADAPIITRHRHRMFVDAGRPDNNLLRNMSERFTPWVIEMMEAGKYIGWIILDGDKPVASAGLLILDWPPHPLDPGRHRGYLLNVYVEPDYRRRRLASQLIDLALAETRRRNIRVLALHTTAAGRPLYVSNGFRPTEEMFYVEQYD
jgi:ribosomal protein S18 acetylase RimI-like enzyme